MTFVGCGVESESSVSLSSSVTINVDTTDTDTNGSDTNGTDSNGTDSNETDPDPTDPDPNPTEFTLFSSEPSESAIDVLVDSSVTITFNNSLDSSTVDVDSFSFTSGGSGVLFSVLDYSDNAVTLKTGVNMEYDSTYVVGINSSLKDIYGNSISTVTSISFTTEAEEVTPVEPEVDAIYDANACGSLSYRAINDNSLDPEGNVAVWEDMGLKITSYYRQGFNPSESEVALFYPKTLEVPKVGSTVFVVETDFSFVFDKAWIDNSESTIYIKSPIINDEFECYRYELNTTTSDEITPVLVYNNL